MARGARPPCAREEGGDAPEGRRSRSRNAGRPTRTRRRRVRPRVGSSTQSARLLFPRLSERAQSNASRGGTPPPHRPTVVRGGTPAAATAPPSCVVWFGLAWFGLVGAPPRSTDSPTRRASSSLRSSPTRRRRSSPSSSDAAASERAAGRQVLSRERAPPRGAAVERPPSSPAASPATAAGRPKTPSRSFGRLGVPPSRLSCLLPSGALGCHARARRCCLARTPKPTSARLC